MGHSPNGYVTGEISAEWIKTFDAATKVKARGRRRLLLVDGHASHYTRAFLEYARNHRIDILCYPFHSTHALQGLDVVIFGPLKQAWTIARDDYEQRGGQVSKRNFLSVYATAHTNALTANNIKSAFRKTGVVPLNPDVITDTMTAPSLVSSSRGVVPLLQTSPVRALTALISNDIAWQAALRNTDEGNTSVHTPPHTPTRARTVTAVLTSTSMAYLVSPTPIPPNAVPPTYHASPISPTKNRYKEILQRQPSTSFEAELLDTLEDAQSREDTHKDQMAAMQAAVVLQGTYVGRAQERMQMQDERKGLKKSQKLMGDGLPKLLSADKFYNLVVDHESAQDHRAAEKADRKADRERYDREMEQWKQLVEEQNKCVTAQNEWYKQAVAEWESEQDLARAERRKTGWEKPKKGIVEPVPSKPRLKRSKETKAGKDEDKDDNEEGDNQPDLAG